MFLSPTLVAGRQRTSSRIVLFSGQSVGSTSVLKRTETAEFVTDNDIDLPFLTERWLKQQDAVGQCAELTPAGCSLRSFSRPSRGGGLSVIFRDSLDLHLSFNVFFLPHPLLYGSCSWDLGIAPEMCSFLLQLPSSSQPKNQAER